MRLIFLPYIYDSLKCETCGDVYVVKYNFVEVIYNKVRVEAEVADMELTYQIHKTNHVLDYMIKALNI